MHGPILFGTGDSRQGPCDIILAVAAGDRAHARLELFWKGPQPWSVTLAPYAVNVLGSCTPCNTSKPTLFALVCLARHMVIIFVRLLLLPENVLLELLHSIVCHATHQAYSSALVCRARPGML